jgi:hypothetical protein
VIEDYYCRDCAARTKDCRTHEARMCHLSVKCPACGGICDPIRDGIEKQGTFEREKIENNGRILNKMRGRV